MAKVISANSLTSLAAQIQKDNLGHVDARLWKQEWEDAWVVYADLIGFGPRAKRSESVVLNNIVRFDRASEIVANWFPTTRIRRFSDATFAIGKTFHDAFAFAIGLSHCCLAFNLEYMVRANIKLFPHLIVPRITIASGRVLLLPESPPDEERFVGITPANVIAGSAVVDAYHLEKTSSGGLITVDISSMNQMSTLKVRGPNGGPKNGLIRWLKKGQSQISPSNGDLFFARGNVIDIPWLLMRPRQSDSGMIWSANAGETSVSLRAFIEVWLSNMRSFYSPQEIASPLVTTKHYASGLRHAVHSFQAARGHTRPGYLSVEEVSRKLKPLPKSL